MKSFMFNTVRANALAAALALIVAAAINSFGMDQTNGHPVSEPAVVQPAVLDLPAMPSTANHTANSDERQNLVLVAEVGAPFCYTDYGVFVMAVSLPAGYPCQVNVNFWPYTIFGITGY